MSRSAALSFCVAASVAAHAAVFGWLASEQPRPGVRGGDTGPAPRAQVRLITPPPPSPVAEAPAEPAATPPIASAQSSAWQVAEPAPPAVTAAAAAAEPAPAAPAALAAPVAAPEAAAAPPPAGDDFDGYVPRALLTVAPVLQGTVLLTWPETDLPDGRYSAIVSLYIDDAGIVRRLVFADDGLPAPLQEQARAAFAGARFEPGQLDGRIVKSIIKIEVYFESNPIARGRP